MSSRAQSLTISSSLAAPPELVWPHITSTTGINEELWPLHMTGPEDGFAHDYARLGRPLFVSVLSLLSVMPIDVHELTLHDLEADEGFHEDSRSLLEKRWVHKRSVRPFEGGSIVLDELEFEPRVFPLFVARIVRKVFERRHAVLRRKFGKLRVDHGWSGERGADISREQDRPSAVVLRAADHLA
jgi:hypothetical protein